MKPTKARFKWFERTIPARLSRSSYVMWLLLFMSSALLTFGYIQDRNTITTLSSQAVPSMRSASEVFLDLSLMQTGMQYELGSKPSAGQQEHFDFNRARNTAWKDLGGATGAIQSDQLPLIGHPDPTLAVLQESIHSAFYTYDHDVSETLAAYNRGDEEAVEAGRKTTSNDLVSNLYPLARKLYEAGSTSVQYEAGMSSPRNATILRAGYVTAVLLIGWIAWQYLFMLRHSRIIVQASIMTLLLSVLAFGYAYHGLRGVDIQIGHAMSENYSGLQDHSLESDLSQKNAKTNETFSSLVTHAVTTVDESATAFQQKLTKAEGDIRYLPAAFFVFMLAGLFYKLAVSRALRDYR